MSGLEGIAALGFACNVLQLIGTVANSITVARNILKSGTINPALEGQNDELTKLFQDVQGSLSQVPVREVDKELRNVAEHILKTTAELKAELAEILGSPLQGKTRKVIGGTIRAFLSQQKLDKLEEKLLTYQKAFELRLLLGLRSRIDLGALQQKDEFTRLDNSLQEFIKGLSDGYTKLEDLLKDQSSTVQMISTTMQAVVRSMDNGEKHRFLYSLRYDAMSDRFNRVEVAHSGTFEWIFRQHAFVEYPDREDPNLQMQQFGHGPGGGDHGEHATDNGIKDEGKGDKLASEAHEGRHDSGSDENIDNGREHGFRRTDFGLQDSEDWPWDDIPGFIRSSTDSIYWITGKPGSGKSTLMKFMAEDSRTQGLLNQISPTHMSIIASHFIWAAGTPVQKSLRGILSSLLFQILTRDEEALDHLASYFPNNPQRLSLDDWSDQQLNKALQMVCSHSRNAVCLFIDGLDEIGADNTHDILRIIDGLSAFPYVKCIVSSRPEEVFSRHFTRRGAGTLRMQDFTESDIRRYATEELSEWVDDSERLRDVVKTLCVKAEGVFLWVALAIKGQRLGAVNKDDPELLARRLEKLPVGLSELYCDMWNRLNEDKDIYGEQGARYLNLLAMEWPPFSLITLLTMAFATQPALVQKSFQPSNLSFLGELEDIMEDHAVWIRVRTAGLIDTETDGLPREIEFVHRSAVEFLENTAEGRAITGLDKTSPYERAVSLLIAELAIIKWECDVERLGRFITHKHSRGYSAPPFDLCERVKSLERLLEDASDLYEENGIEETIYFEALDYAAATHEAIGLLGDKYPLRKCNRFPTHFSGDFLGFMARLGSFEYVSKKIEELSTEREMCPSYLEYLRAEICYGIFQACSEPYSSLGSGQVERLKTMRQWLSTLQQKHSLASTTSLLGGCQRTTKGLVCTRLLGTIVDFCIYQDIALQSEVCKSTILQDAPYEYRALFKIPWYKSEGVTAHSLVKKRPPYHDHIFEHVEEFNIYFEIPIMVLLKFQNDRASSAPLSAESYEDLLHKALPTTTKEAPVALVIQSWIDMSHPPKALSATPERYFLLENEEDRRFVTDAVMRALARSAWDRSLRLQHVASSESVKGFPATEGSVMNQANQSKLDPDLRGANSHLRGEALSGFVNKKTADNSLKLISPSQFDDLLLERGHAFKPSSQRPWPPAMFDEGVDLRPNQISDTKLEDILERASENTEPEQYHFYIQGKFHSGVLDGDVVHSILVEP